MNTSALIMMLSVWLLVFGFTAYFFIRVLMGDRRTKKNGLSENTDLN
ncbi:MAG: hypothetical protein GX419_02565 [Bacteroidales bacterium]|jgi:heme/copper-type cytochrome/quinol oxidase subunit 2|nr:hypothetical protein [Bacteroidales bacterium]